MDEPRMLSGSQLVAIGVTKKVDGKLPGLGVKEVSPNGSWLEQKQIQSALEARKHMIKVERIEKSGSLSHAVWRDDLQLAEVIQKTGGHWQYLGHNVGKHVYLLPEETLFLLESNCLLLKHNEVTVSLQKAYSLCLGDISIAQYKVYASLSRLGYRVFRHKQLKEPHDDKTNNLNDSKVNHSTDIRDIEHPVEFNEHKAHVIETSDNSSSNKSKGEEKPSSTDEESVPRTDISVNELNVSKSDNTQVREETNRSVCCADVINNVNENNATSDSITMNVDNNANETMFASLAGGENISSDNRIATVNKTVDTEISNTSVVYSVDELGVIRNFREDVLMKANPVESESKKSSNTKEPNPDAKESTKLYETEINYYTTKMQKLIERKTNTRSNLEGLCTMQDFHQKQVASVNVPDEKYLPRNIFLHKTAYVLNIDIVRNQNATSVNVSSDEIDQIETPSLRESCDNNAPNQNFPNFPQNFRNPNYNRNSYRPYRAHFRFSPPWRPQQNCNTYYNYNMFRPNQSFFAQQRYRFQPHHQFIRQQFINHEQTGPQALRNNQYENRQHAMKMFHYNTIVSIATRFKNSLCTPSQVQALNRLLCTYNSHYHEHIEMAANFDIVDRKEQARKALLEVIVLDDEPKPKKARLNDDNEDMKQNLEKLKTLAAKLKDLQMKDLAVSRHRRVFSNAIKTFNKMFKADIYLDSDFEIQDRKLVVIESSSDSDAVVTVEDSDVKRVNKSKKRKKLRNPYNILKRCSRIDIAEASSSRQVPTLQTLSLNVNNVGITSQNGLSENDIASPITGTGEGLLKYFNKAWLPSDDDFGKVELCSRLQARLDALIFEQESLTENLKESAEFENWLDLKISMLKDLKRTIEIQKQHTEALSNDFWKTTESQIQPIVKPHCSDLRSALKALAIIPTNKDVPAETRLRIDFDVCNRDVNIKKTNLPKPNFRVVCLDESAPFPSSEDVVALQSKYTDGVPNIFAFIGDSISYLHINSIDLPVFIPDDLA